MSRIEAKFRELAERNERALVCFLTAGDPDAATSETAILETASAGADIIEIGIPFSDPLADGPSIQAASQRALDAGMTIKKSFELVNRIRKETDLPLVLMTYFNPVQRYGIARFSEDAISAGADGVIITDLPPEEAREWKAAAKSVGLDTIFLLAPTSTDERIRRVADIDSGFIYCVSRTGVTGTQRSLSSEVNELVARIRAVTKKPIAVGFGVSGPAQVREISQFADGAVVGSALVDLVAAKSKDHDLKNEIQSFVSSLKEATRATAK